MTKSVYLTRCLAQGEVALSIADDAWKVAFYISFDDGKYSIPGKTQENIADLRQSFVDPDAQSEFTEQVVENVTEIEPGHQCYKIDAIPSSVSAGSNATIQLAYWSNYEDENNGKNETFYACADIVRLIRLLSSLSCSSFYIKLAGS